MRADDLDAVHQPARLDQAFVLPVLHRVPVRVPIPGPAGRLRRDGVLVRPRDRDKDSVPQFRSCLTQSVRDPAEKLTCRLHFSACPVTAAPL